MTYRTLRRLGGALALMVTLSVLARAQANSVSLATSAAGITSLRYDGWDYLAYGDFRLNAIKFRNAGTVLASAMPYSVQYDAARQSLTRTYTWGTVQVTYAAVGNRLDLTITTTNRGADPIQGLYYEPLGVRFPVKPAEYDGNTPLLSHGVGEPTALAMTHGTTALILCNNDPSRPLLVGTPGALDRPGPMLTYPLRLNTDRENVYPNSLPYIDRPVLPGAFDTYRISLRFVPAGTPLKVAASDVYAAFAAIYPPRLNWPDRRPIGSLILATAATGWSTNPRGWLLDPSLNVFTPAGLTAFRQRVLSWADNAVRVLKDANAQGMITWDIEGEQFPHATTYIGDPRVFATLAPEMANIADDYFAKFRAAGLRIGVCLRPQQIVISADGRTVNQTEAADPAQVLIDKISFAKTRWGATLFYIDSNGDPSLPISVGTMARVAAAHPDVLLIPEHENTAYFSLTAPYNELRGGIVSTPQQARDIYPASFSILNTADGPIEARFVELQAAVARGDILMFRGWFDDPGNALVKRLYPTQADVAPPSVSLAAPANGSTVTGAITVSVNATDNVGVAGVRLLLDGVAFGAELSASPYAAAWDTRTAGNGAHTLSAVARDTAGNTATAAATVIVQNTPADTRQPTVRLTSPTAGALLTGTVALSADATDDTGVTGVRFQLDGASFGPTLVAPPYAVSLDTRALANGAHTVCVVAYDAAGNYATSGTITVLVGNTVADTTPPLVSFSSPAANATLSGVIAVAASASDNVGVAGVRLLVDGSPLGAELQAAPYAMAWDTRTAANGAHTLTAVARDAAGNTATAAVSIQVRNYVPDTTPPTVSFLSPSDSAVVVGDVSVSAIAADASGIASVQFAVDGAGIGASITSAPYAVSWNTRLVANGSHVLTVSARDGAGNQAVGRITVVISNAVVPPTDTTPPTVSLTAPAGNSTVSSTVLLSANASDNVGVAAVTFSIDNVVVGTVTSAPYTLPFDTAALMGGPHYFEAAARDAAGNTRVNGAFASVSAGAPPPCGTVGIRVFAACYYANDSLSGAGTARIDPELNFDWAYGGPLPGFPSDFFSARWLGAFAFDGGNYGFDMLVDDEVRFYVDDVLVLDTWNSPGYNRYYVERALTPGTHVIRVDYRERTIYAAMKLNWSRR